MNAEKIDFNNKLTIDTFIQDQTIKPEKINVKIHPQDEMYLYALKNTDGRKDEALLRYFSNGKRILDAVKQIVEWYFDGFENISSFLDFASGYGRFSRFLLQEIPIDKIWVSDIYPGAVEFQKQEFSVAGIVSTNAPEDYQINQKFDCIFACSFFSHTPQKTFTGWLEKLYSCLTENGILIFSTHDLSLMTIETDVEAEEIYFTPESESLFLKTEDYGVTYVGEKWVGKVIQKVTQGKAKWHRIKRGLCGYHDLYIVWNNVEGRRKKEEGRSWKEEIRKEDVLINSEVAGKNSEGRSQKEEVIKEDVLINSEVAGKNSEERSQKEEVIKEDVLINSEVVGKKSEVGKEDVSINSEVAGKNSEGRSQKEELIKEEVRKENVLINSEFAGKNSEGRSQKEEVIKEDVLINSEVVGKKSEVGKEDVSINSEVGSKKSEVGKKDIFITSEVIKEGVAEQIDELLNFHCHPDGGCKQIKMTATGDIYLEGWAADINLEEKVEKISVLANGKEVGSCCPKHETQSQRYEWSFTINSQNLSADDIILVKIINNFNLERVVNISPVNNIALLPPSHLLLRISGNPSAKAFLSSFDDLKYTVKNYLQSAGFNFNQFENILDFGCGVGRYLMAFEPELLPNQKLFGCDVFAECAEWCQENIKFATVKHNDIQPPLPFENNQFDLINAISVFTHLSLDLQHLWAWDIYRVLRPGGILFMTLHGPQFFPIVYDIFRTGNAHKAEMYSIGEEGLFLYLDHQGETDGQGQHTIAAVHTPTAYQEIFSMFKHIKRFPQSNLANGQDLYILQKPISGSLVAQPLKMNSEFRIQDSEVKNLLKEEEVATVKEEIIGKKIEVEKIPISDNQETKNLSEKILSETHSNKQVTRELEELPLSDNQETKNLEELLSDNQETENLPQQILSDSQTQKQVIREVEELPLSNDGKTENLPQKILSDSQTQKQVIREVEELPLSDNGETKNLEELLSDNQETENLSEKILSETHSNKQVTREVEELPLSDNQETENLPQKIFSDSQINNQVKTEVEELPLSDNQETGNLPEKIFSDSHQCQTEIKFQIEGQKRFRVYPQIQPIGTYSIACEIEIISSKNGKILVQKNIPLNNKNIFGKTNYGVI
ncbi:MAG: methyltransferase [Trichodesmium sp. MO_231.B1]|nr:methyltransferase [Trichodesmium sp. MO_231.B1]